MTVPEVTIPEVTIPEVTIPEVTVPEVTVPEVALHSCVGGGEIYFKFCIGQLRVFYLSETTHPTAEDTLISYHMKHMHTCTLPSLGISVPFLALRFTHSCTNSHSKPGNRDRHFNK